MTLEREREERDVRYDTVSRVSVVTAVRWERCSCFKQEEVFFRDVVLNHIWKVVGWVEPVIVSQCSMDESVWHLLGTQHVCEHARALRSVWAQYTPSLCLLPERATLSFGVSIVIAIASSLIALLDLTQCYGLVFWVRLSWNIVCHMLWLWPPRMWLQSRVSFQQ